MPGCGHSCGYTGNADGCGRHAVTTAEGQTYGANPRYHNVFCKYVPHLLGAFDKSKNTLCCDVRVRVEAVGVGREDLAQFILWQLHQKSDAPGAHTQWPPIADVDYEGLDRERSFFSIDAQGIKTATHIKKNRVPSVFRDSRRNRIAQFS